MSSRRIGNYQIIEYIGSGGFGSVFKAEDTSSPGRVVAIKELHRRHTRNTVIKQRFFQEAVAMARLDHANLPRLYTFGEDNGSYYLVMEFLSGILLSEEIQQGSIPADSAVAIMAQVLEALGYAHRNGIIHRDLKPDNIMLLDGSALRIKVLDFGIARMVGGENLTLAGEGFGTPAYMSPERMTGTTGDDPRIDIYSAGIILFEMLAGHAPFQSTASDPVIFWSEMRKQHEHYPVPPLAPLGAPAELEEVVTRATAKRIEDRYATAEDMLADLKRINTGALVASVEAQASATRLFLTTVPAGAEVYVDDEMRGVSDAIRGKILIDGLAAGLHSVRVSKNGYNEYRISVSLEEGRQTDLQVALPARSTIAMPPSDSTAAGGFDTVKFDQSDNRTTLFVVESLPAGATLLLGDNAVARADEEGRATVKLAPGAHEIEVKAPSGATTKRLVTVSMADVGPTKTMATPVEPTAAAVSSITQSEPRPVAIERSPRGKRVAAAAIVVLLLAIAAVAFFVMRGPDRGDAQSDQQAQQATVALPSQPSAPASQVPPPAQQPSEEKKVAEETKKSEEEAERASAEKQQADKQPAAPETPAISPPSPVPAAPQVSPPGQSSLPQEACIAVVMTGPVDKSSFHLRVIAVEQPDTSAASVYNGRTNERGFWNRCGMKSGNRMRVAVIGARGGFRASRDIVLTPGRNVVEFQVTAAPAGARDGEQQIPPRMRRPGARRP